MGEINQRRLQRRLVQIGLIERRVLRRECLQRAVGLFDAPTQLAPEPDEEVDPEKVHRAGLVAVRVLERGLVEVAACVGVGQDKNFIEGLFRNRRLQPRSRVETGGLVLLRKRVQPLLERFHLGQTLFVFIRHLAFVFGEQMRVLRVEENIAGLDAQLAQDDQRFQLRVDEACADNLHQFLVTHTKPPRERFGGIQVNALTFNLKDCRRFAFGFVTVKFKPRGQRVRVGEDGVLGERQPQRFGEDGGAVISLRRREQGIAGAECLQHLPQRRFKVVAELPHSFEPEIERQRERIPRFKQRVVCGGQYVLRFGQQFRCRRVAGVARGVGLQRVVGDVVLKNFVDDVNVRQRRVRVLAGELDVRQIGAAFDQYLIRRLFRVGIGRAWMIVAPLRQKAVEGRRILEGIRRAAVLVLPNLHRVRPDFRLGVQELQQVNEIGRRAEHRAAMLAFAEIQ
ncbi:MAG: hypothetical protein JMDDDDMK_01369 [Acidobacteria bacterium]|nr:hypothetical protein [Acidobacteriota bacterium]